MESSNCHAAWHRIEHPPQRQTQEIRLNKVECPRFFAKVECPRFFAVPFSSPSYGDRTQWIDGLGNTHKYQDRNGRVIRYAYDELYRLTKEIWEGTSGDIRTIEFSYDTVGNVSGITDTDLGTNTPASDSLEFAYDDRYLISASLTDNPLLPDSIGFEYGYDARGLLSEMTANEGSSLTGGVLVGGTDLYENDYAYNRRGQLTELGQDGLVGVHDKTVTYAYNDAGQLADLKRYNTLQFSGADPTVHSRHGYDGAARLQSISHRTTSLGTGVAWDGVSWNTFAAAYFYEYDVANRLTSMSSFTDGSKASYSYDDRNQLTSVAYTAVAGPGHQLYDSSGNEVSLPLPSGETYAFDGAGNREVSGTSSSSNGSHNRVQNDGTYTYTYDNAGNQLTKTEISSGDVTTYEYDHRNRLVKVSTTTKVVTYQYDALDHRTGKHVDDGANGSIDRSEAWVWNGGHAAMRFEDADGDGSQPFELTNHYLYGSMVDMLLAEDLVGPSSGPSDGILWPLADHLGSVRDIVNSDGVRREHRVYDSFGNVTSETDYDDYYGSLISSTASDAVDSAIGYTGREWDDDVDLQYNRGWTVTGTVGWESRPVIVMDLGSDHLLVFQVWPAVVNSAGLQATNKQ